MIKKLQSKKLAIAVMALVSLSAIALAVLAGHYFLNMDFTMQMPICIDGVYSIDGGDWKPVNENGDIKDTFHKAVVKGTLKEEAFYMKTITITSKNVWYTLKKADGTTFVEYKNYSPEELYNEYLKWTTEENFNEEVLSFDEYLSDIMGFDNYVSCGGNSPGYYVCQFEINTYDWNKIEADEEFILEVEYPYDLPKAELGDCLSCLISESNGNYMQFFYKLPWVFLFVLICFFGLFFFPIAGFIMGKIDYSYFAFGAVCFFWGLFMLVGSVSSFMNLWIMNSVACLIIEKMTNYFFIISIIFYLKSNLTNYVSRMIGNLLGMVFFLLMITFVTLHFCGISDLHATSMYMFLYTALCTVIMAVLLCIEVCTKHIDYGLLLSWIPLAICVIIDALNHYFQFTIIDFYYFGIAITMIYQLVRSVNRLRKQYEASIRYQKLQKELYEAEVRVMVSQIRPHFMYNALSSIAMLCKLDPETAYQATITFSQYLRSNMDSLKQKEPVPFEQELEHLKKYLYIEKLRFGKKLNIVYDIQTTDFVLPQLSIQPLAENAVKHGISKKRGGGTLTIATRETDKFYEVIVSDDGTGFDVNEVKNDGRSHIGMENIRTRLKEMCNAEVEINSVIGEGTVATVRLPKADNKKIGSETESIQDSFEKKKKLFGSKHNNNQKQEEK